MPRPSPAERAKLRSGLRARLGKPEPAPKRVSEEEQLRQRMLILEDMEDRMSVDAERPSERRRRIESVPEPAGRTAPVWQRRKPVIKGGAVIGRREPSNTA